MLYSFLKVILKGLFFVFLRLKVEGEENIPESGAIVVASNHLSLLDPPVLGTASTRKIHFMAKQELFVPVLGDLYKALGAFPVRRGGADRAAIKHGIDLLKEGKALAIFPEGTRSRTGELGKAEPGALMMAGRAKAVVVPACVIGTDFVREKRLWPKVTVRFGKPMRFSGEAVNKELLQRMTDELMRRIASLKAGEKV